jgi:hypothetical protein
MKRGAKSERVLRYTNRRGQVYYLHAGTTKTGKRRYFVAKTVGEGALDELPAGFEIVESINGVVSVRRVDPAAPRVPDLDLARVRAELAKHSHLRRHRADVVKGEIIVFEPLGGMWNELEGDLLARLRIPRARIERARSELEKRTRYTPVMRFVPLPDGAYALFRMTYRGEGGWSRWELDRGPLDRLASRYLKQIGTSAFFELL